MRVCGRNKCKSMLIDNMPLRNWIDKKRRAARLSDGIQEEQESLELRERVQIERINNEQE